MRIYNHLVIEALKLVGTKEPLKIEYEGKSNYCIFKIKFSVLVTRICQKLGMNPSKLDIANAVKQVMDFFKKSKVKKKIVYVHYLKHLN